MSNLLAGRVVSQYLSGTQTRRIGGLLDKSRDDGAEFNLKRW